MPTITKITPCLWFDTEAEDAAGFYVKLVDGSSITEVSRYGAGGPRPEGLAMMVSFELAGQPFLALNGGPEYKLTEAVSFMVSCEDQAEVDSFWKALTSDGGEEGPCGWCKDKFGLSWQIVPTALPRLLTDPDPERAQRAMQAMMGMKKLDVAELERAAAG
jgi:predicted 3-demethylubiquinone-9 3-methyltransferase (glyoxalase superfamily)